MFPFSGNHRPQLRSGVAGAQSIHADKAFLAASPQGRIFRISLDFISCLPQQIQQRFKALGLLRKQLINELAEPFPVRNRLLVSQPLVVTLALALWVFYNGIAVLNANGIVESVQGLRAAPKITELSGVVQRDGGDNDVVMDVRLIRMGGDDIGVVALGEAPRQLLAQAVCFLRGDLSGDKGLPQVVGDHIILAALPAGFLTVEIFEQQKLRVRDLWIALVASDKLPALGLVRILHISDNVPDGGFERPALSDVQGNQARGCQIRKLASFP